jgi:hypothetical protein
MAIIFKVIEKSMTVAELKSALQESDERAAAAARFIFNDGDILNIAKVSPVIVDDDKPDAVVVMPVTDGGKFIAWGNFCEKSKIDCDGNVITFGKSNYTVDNKIAIFNDLIIDEKKQSYHSVTAHVKRFFTKAKNGNIVPTTLTRFTINK